MNSPPIKFKIDENLPEEVAAALVAAGHEAMTVHQQRLSGEDDDRIGTVCLDEDRAIVTFDLGFADIRRHPAGNGLGAIVLRLRHQETPRVLAVFVSVIELLKTEPLRGRLWIVDDAGVRIRGDAEIH